MDPKTETRLIEMREYLKARQDINEAIIALEKVTSCDSELNRFVRSAHLNALKAWGIANSNAAKLTRVL